MIEPLLRNGEFVLTLTCLYSTGRAVNSVLADQPFAHRPLLRGIADYGCYPSRQLLYMVDCIVGRVGSRGILVLWAVPWLFLKHLTGKLKRWEVLWPIVIYNWIRRGFR
jgi:hypothetical protein